ncbi:MAG: glycosyltransferase family 2 protein [Xanthomonadaceae bacterium]|nr:glycosyltransferase family 2 protein [Xanthomonadaceae bacterium]
MSANPTISIVITCYNYARYVALAIESALSQTRPPDQIIVVDDGSTDDSAQVIERYADRIAFVRQANRGHVAAVNRGYAASSGDIVLFLDADDALRAEAVEEIVAAWDSRCTKVQFELDVIDAEGHHLRRFCNYVEAYDTAQIDREFERFGTYVWPVLSGNAYSRRYLDALMPLGVKRAPDGYLNTLAPLYGPVRVVRKPLACYRLHDSNLNYHGAADDYGRRFASRVSLRLRELAQLRQHAQRRAVSLPSGNLLDHDLTFVNYRLMLQRLGTSYEGSTRDSVFRLWRTGLRVIGQRPNPLRLKAAHALWLTSLACSPRPIAKRLIAARFNRGVPVHRARRKAIATSNGTAAADEQAAQPSA